MSEGMKLLVAYDGSSCADAAVDDLRRAGLPRSAEVIVLTVADVWLPPPPPDQAAEGSTPAAAKARAQATQALEQARKLAVQARTTVQQRFPTWHVQAEAYADSPAWGIIKRADEWQANLITVGSHGRSALGRFILGSVSQKVLAHARCSVRIARGRKGGQEGPNRLVVGVDGSPDADAAVTTVAARTWPPGSEVRVVAAVDPVMTTAVAFPALPVMNWVGEADEDQQAWVRKMVEAAAERLRGAGLTVSSHIVDGDPKLVLTEEAEYWGADCIFVGASGLGGLERFVLGSVSMSVATRSHCSVEVVRVKPPAEG